MHVKVLQFIPPLRRQEIHTTEVADDCAVGYESMARHNCRLTAEVLSTPGREVSLCIEHEEGDYDNELVRNGPAVTEALEKMLRRFDGAQFEKWLRIQLGDEQEEAGNV
jgi:hypothetical protein